MPFVAGVNGTLMARRALPDVRFFGAIAGLSSLGYENSNERLSCLAQSPVTASASADWQYEAVPGLLRLSRLAPSRVQIRAQTGS
jgi:hypothetical protein